MPATEAHVRTSELERVEQWRAEALERAGYSPDAAATLAAHHEVDLHLALDLVEQGCPPEIAVQILL